MLTSLNIGSFVGFRVATASANVSSTRPCFDSNFGGQGYRQQADTINPVDEFTRTPTGLTCGYVDQGLMSDATARADLLLVTTDRVGRKDGRT